MHDVPVGIDDLNLYAARSRSTTPTSGGPAAPRATSTSSASSGGRSRPRSRTPVTLAVNAARPLVEAAGPDAFELLIVATESGFDFGKPLSSYVHRHLGLGRRCRNLEVKHACYGGTASLQLAAGWLRSGVARGKRALVVTTDLPGNQFGEPAEMTPGTGAVALSLAEEPRVLELDRASGLRGARGLRHRAARPRPGHWVDEVLSLGAYLDLLEDAYAHYRAQVPGDVLRDFDHVVYHMPVETLVRKAHGVLLEADDPDATADAAAASFERMVAPSLALLQRDRQHLLGHRLRGPRGARRLGARTARRAPASPSTPTGPAPAPSSSRAPCGRRPAPSWARTASGRTSRPGAPSPSRTTSASCASARPSQASPNGRPAASCPRDHYAESYAGQRSAGARFRQGLLPALRMELNAARGADTRIVLPRRLSWEDIAACTSGSSRRGAGRCTFEGTAGVFCEGGALDPAATAEPRPELFAALLRAIEAAPVVVLAVVDGPALGAGAGIAAAADVVIATPRARFGLPETVMGLVPAMVFPVLARRLGVARARRLALGAAPLTAEEALAQGLADEVGPGRRGRRGARPPPAGAPGPGRRGRAEAADRPPFRDQRRRTKRRRPTPCARAGRAPRRASGCSATRTAAPPGTRSDVRDACGARPRRPHRARDRRVARHRTRDRARRPGARRARRLLQPARGGRRGRRAAERSGCARSGADVAREEDVDAFFGEAACAFGPPDVVVSNAGVSETALLVGCETRTFDALLRDEPHGRVPGRRARPCGPSATGAARSCSWARSSSRARRGAPPRTRPARAAWPGSSGASLRDHGARGVRANQVVTGFVETDLTRDLPDVRAQARARHGRPCAGWRRWRRSRRSRCSSRRSARPGLNGATLHASGGLQEMYV